MQTSFETNSKITSKIDLEEYCRMVLLKYHVGEFESCEHGVILKHTPYWKDETLQNEITFDNVFRVGNVSIDIYPFDYPKSWESEIDNALKVAIVLSSNVYELLAKHFDFLNKEPHKIFINFDDIIMESIYSNTGFNGHVNSKAKFGIDGVSSIVCSRLKDCPYISLCNKEIIYHRGEDSVLCNGFRIEKTNSLYEDIYSEIQKIDIPSTVIYKWIIDALEYTYDKFLRENSYHPVNVKFKIEEPLQVTHLKEIFKNTKSKYKSENKNNGTIRD